MSLFRRHAGKSRARNSIFWFESLEDRVYLSLVPSIVGTLPTSLIATEKTSAQVTVDLTNTGSTSIKGKYTLILYADTTNSTTTLGTLTQIVPENETLAPLAAGKTRSVKIPIGKFPDVANGNYYILAELGGALTTAGTNVAASSTAIAITDPFIDLTGTVAFISPKSLTIKAGQSFEYSVEVVNHGNVAAKGPLDIDIAYSANSNGSAPNGVKELKESINLNPGAHTTYSLSLIVPTDTPPGTYYLVADVDPGNTFHESNASNNISVTTNALTIKSPYPNLVGSYSEISTVTSGPDRGHQYSVTLVVTSEGNDGSLTGTLTIDGTAGTLTGSVTTAGVITTRSTVGGIVYHGIGTMKNGKYTGTFSGIGFTGTLVPAVQVGTLPGVYIGTDTNNLNETHNINVDIVSEESDGDFDGTMTDLTTGVAANFTGQVVEATGHFTLTLVIADVRPPFDIDFIGTAFDGSLSGTYAETLKDGQTGTFNVSEDV